MKLDRVRRERIRILNEINILNDSLGEAGLGGRDRGQTERLRDQRLLELGRLAEEERAISAEGVRRGERVSPRSHADALEATLRLAKQGVWKSSFERSDASGQFTDGIRSQGKSGACTIFAGVALLESAYAREYGVKLDFSEMWILREAVRRELSGRGKGDAFWLGMSVRELLAYVKREGICEEADDPYPSRTEDLARLESLSPALGKDRARARLLAREIFGEESSPPVSRCVARAAYHRPRFEGFRSICVANASQVEVLWLLGQGLPVLAHLARYGPEGVSHALVIDGFDRREEVLSLRSSWGHSGETMSIRDAWAGVGRSVAQNLLKACALAAPSDVSRACVDRGSVPSRLVAELCAE